jgi:hypothetical protein
MGASDELEAIDMIELHGDLVSEEPACTTGRNSPGLNILGITPDQVTEGTLVRDLLRAGYNTDLIHRTDLGAQTTVDTENLTINDGSEDKEIKDLAARLPDRRVAVLLLALLVEAVDLSNLAGLMVTANEGDLVWVPWLCQLELFADLQLHLHSLQAHQQRKRLQTEVAAIDKVTKENEVLITGSRNGVYADARITTGAATTA